MSITPHQHQILQMYLAGMTGADIAKQLGLTPSTVYSHLRNPLVKAVIAERMREADMVIVDFKLKALYASMDSLDQLINLSRTASDDTVKRAASKDVIEIAGLMPRKRVLVQGEGMNGIDKDTVEYFDDVVAEIAEVTEQP